MEGRTFFGHHSEVTHNPYLTGKEGQALYQQIMADFRKSVVTRIYAYLTQKVTQERAHLELPERTQDRVRNDQLKFADLTKSYKIKHGMYTSEPFLRRRNTDYKVPGSPSTGHRRSRSERDDSSSGNDDSDKPDDHGS